MRKRIIAGLVLVLGVGIAFVAAGMKRDPSGDGHIRWQHLTSKQGDLEAPNSGNQQTASLVLDIDGDGRNDFVIAERTAAPAVVWYRRSKDGWTKHVVEAGPLHIEAGGAFADIDGDGDLDIVFGGDASSSQVWWWENPYPQYEPNTPWTRREIKNSGPTKHHDQIFGDFDGDGRLELAYWNQRARHLYLAPIPADPKQTQPWPATAIYTSESESEGLAATDIDGDGKTDIVGGGRWFKHAGGVSFTPHVIDDAQRFSRAAAGQLNQGGRPEVVFVVGDGVGRLKWYGWTGEDWVGHDLLGMDVVHGHSLQVTDVDGDGNLDIFCAEMGKWTEKAAAVDNPQAKLWVFFGDGKGNFKKEEVATGYGNHESRVADLDGDGDLDILGKPYNWDTPRLDIWLRK
ncbi:MAG: VCBS repeat-containing protein [Acidobacteria bacterium]|nr:VCBS repeat-containing protein [Acidobacteriota bacterium]